MGWWEVLFPSALGEAEIRVLSGSDTGRAVSVRFIVKTLTIAKKNEFAAQDVPGLNGELLQFIHGRARTLSAVLSFDGRSTDTDVRQLMTNVTGLMKVDWDTHAPPRCRSSGKARLFSASWKAPSRSSGGDIRTAGPRVGGCTSCSERAGLWRSWSKKSDWNRSPRPGAGDAGVVHDLAVDHGEHRADLLDLHVGHGEVVPIEHDQIGELARLDRADAVFHPQEPAVAAREQAQRLLRA